MISGIRLFFVRYMYWVGGLRLLVGCLILAVGIGYFGRLEMVTPFTLLVFYFAPQLTRWSSAGHPYSGKHRKAIMDLAGKLDCRLGELYETGGDGLNAQAVGFGGNTAVCISRGTLERCSWQELEAVMAHEIGHHKNADLWMYAVLTVAAESGAVVIAHAFSEAYTGLLVSYAVCVFIAGMAFSRWREAKADDFARQHVSGAAGLGKFLSRVIVEKRKQGVNIPDAAPLVLHLMDMHPWITQRARTFGKTARPASAHG